MVNSRDKGARGERELANWLKDLGLDARRGQQYSGGSDSPDVVCPDLVGLHIEVKRTERLNLYAALSQAQFDAMGQAVPTVWHRKNKREWVVILDARQFLDIWKDARGSQSSPPIQTG